MSDGPQMRCFLYDAQGELVREIEMVPGKAPGEWRFKEPVVFDEPGCTLQMGYELSEESRGQLPVYNFGGDQPAYFSNHNPSFFFAPPNGAILERVVTQP